MKAVLKLVACGFVVLGALTTAGCETLDKAHAGAVAERAANPEKYTEIPEVKRAQMTANQNGSAYPEFCTFGCPTAEERIDLTRNH